MNIVTLTGKVYPYHIDIEAMANMVARAQETWLADMVAARSAPPHDATTCPTCWWVRLMRSHQASARAMATNHRLAYDASREGEG